MNKFSILYLPRIVRMHDLAAFFFVESIWFYVLYNIDNNYTLPPFTVNQVTKARITVNESLHSIGWVMDWINLEYMAMIE